MSQRSETAVTVAAILLLVAAIPLTWFVADVRQEQAMAEKRAELAQDQVPTRQAQNDWDGDGIRDGRDVCPTRPETTNGFQDDDGCPDLVATTGAS